MQIQGIGVAVQVRFVALIFKILTLGSDVFTTYANKATCPGGEEICI